MHTDDIYIKANATVYTQCCRCDYEIRTEVFFDGSFSHEPDDWCLDISECARKKLEDRGWVHVDEGWLCYECAEELCEHLNEK